MFVPCTFNGSIVAFLVLCCYVGLLHDWARSLRKERGCVLHGLHVYLTSDGATCTGGVHVHLELFV
jgi:hypothetical protein